MSAEPVEAACRTFFANSWEHIPENVKEQIRPRMAGAIIAAIRESKHFRPEAGITIDPDTFAWPCGCSIVDNHQAHCYEVRACSEEHDIPLETFVRTYVPDVRPEATFYRVDPGQN